MDRLSTLERYGVTPSGDVLLSKERTFYDGNAYQGLGHPDATSSIGVTKGNLSCKLVLAFEERRRRLDLPLRLRRQHRPVRPRHTPSPTPTSTSRPSATNTTATA